MASSSSAAARALSKSRAAKAISTIAGSSRARARRARGRRIAQVELHQLAAGAPGLLLRLAPGPPQAHDLSPVDAAHARKASDRLPLTPAFGRLRPVRGAPVGGQ